MHTASYPSPARTPSSASSPRAGAWGHVVAGAVVVAVGVAGVLALTGGRSDHAGALSPRGVLLAAAVVGGVGSALVARVASARGWHAAVSAAAGVAWLAAVSMATGALVSLLAPTSPSDGQAVAALDAAALGLLAGVLVVPVVPVGFVALALAGRAHRPRGAHVPSS